MIESKWPKQNADFYKHAEKVEYSLELYCNKSYSETFYEYSNNFKAAAHLVTEYILEKAQIGMLDTYFFALAYLYRHSLELILKAIGFKFVLDEVAFIKDTFHNLAEILKVIKPYIQDEILCDSNAYEWLKEYFMDMETIDKDSDAFRYPFKIVKEKDTTWGMKTTIYGIRDVFEKQTHIDLVKFANKMEIAYDILNSYYLEGKDICNEYTEYKPIFLEIGGDYYQQSVVGYGYTKDRYGPYVKAYSETGEYLAEYIKEHLGEKEKMFFPMSYLFRNAIELELKQVWFEECEACFQEKCKKLGKKKHSIQGLWNLIHGDLIHHSQGENDQSVIMYVDNYIEQLHNFDSTSSRFRYPTDSMMKYHFNNRVYLDVENVSDFFIELSEFLQAVDYMIADHNQISADMQAEYANEWY